MLETIVTALLPIVVTLLLGYFAGWHHDCDQAQAGVLNRMVMRYALPMLLVAGILTTSLAEVTANRDVFIWIAIGMVGGFLVVCLLSRFVFRSDAQVAALRGLVIAGPAVPFVGPTVLGTIFPTDASLAIAAGGLLMNLFQVPLSLVLLASGAAPGAGAKTRKSPLAVVGSSIRSAVTQPVVWAPVGAFVLLLLGVQMPDWLKGSFTTLGQATGGVALFAVGAVLYAQKVIVSLPVVVNVVAKNLVLPGVILVAMLALAVPAVERGITTVTLAIPSGSIPVIFAVQYQAAEKEMASSLFFSTILSVLTMGMFIWLTGA